jgi:ATP-dependent DNA helicase RecG
MMIEEFLKKFEGEELEFRAKFKNDEDRERDIRVISSFFNGRGGILFFGISEDGTNRQVVGTDMPPQTIEGGLTNKLRGKCNPEMRPLITIHEIDDKHVIEVKCPRGKQPPYKVNGVVYIRRNSSTFPATEDDIADLYKQRQPQFDKEVLDQTGLADLNMERFKKMLETRDSQQILDGDLEKLLIRNGLAVKDGTSFHLTIAGLLLFGNKPQDFLKHAKVLVQMTSSEDPNNWEYIDQFEGNIFDQIEKIERFFRENLRKSAKVIGFERKEELEIPIQALREAVINALVHRDYHDAKSEIQISMTPQNVRIVSPGGLVAPLTLKEIEEGAFIPTTRNPVIAEMLMDKRGTGIKRMISLVVDTGLGEPTIQELTGGKAFEVSFKRSGRIQRDIVETKISLPQEVLTSLDDVERKVLILIEKDKEVKPSRIEAALKLSRPKVNDVLGKLVNGNIIKRIAKSNNDPRVRYVIHPRFELSRVKNDPVDNVQGSLFNDKE